jgi:hypothetical protein
MLPIAPDMPQIVQQEQVAIRADYHKWINAYTNQGLSSLKFELRLRLLHQQAP